MNIIHFIVGIAIRDTGRRIQSTMRSRSMQSGESRSGIYGRHARCRVATGTPGIIQGAFDDDDDDDDEDMKMVMRSIMMMKRKRTRTDEARGEHCSGYSLSAYSVLTAHD